MKHLIPFLFLLTLPGCGNQAGEPKESNKAASDSATSYLDKPITGKLIQHGLYKLLRSGGVVDNPKTGTGKVVAKPVIQLVESTERIPLIKGAQMYLQYRIRPFPDNPVYVDFRQVLKHPEMTLPDGSVSTGSDIPFKGKVSANQSIGYIGYGFDEDYELVEGNWVFEVWYQDKKLVEQTFTTYWPGKEAAATLASRLAPSKGDGMPVPATPLPEKDWPRERVYDLGKNPALKDVVPLNAAPGATEPEV